MKTTALQPFVLPAVASAVLFASAGCAPAQAPAGLVLLAAFDAGPWHPRTGMPGGLWILHPRTAIAPQPVQGLPLEITGAVAAAPGFDVGLGSVLVLPGGDVLVGEMTPPPGTVPGVDGVLEVHRLALLPSGGTWSATVVASHVLGTAATGSAEVSSMRLSPDGNVLIAVNNLGGPTFAQLFVLDPIAGTVSPRPLTGFPAGSSANSLAISRDGSTVFLGEFQSFGYGRIWQAPWSPAGALAAVPLTPASATTMGGVMSIDRDDQDRIVVGTFGAGGVQGATPNLYSVDPASGVVTPLAPAIASRVRNAVAVEHATDSIFTGGDYVDLSWPGSVALVPDIVAPWSIVAGLAVVPSLVPFGAQSTCVSTGSYEWEVAPNPGGIPLVGGAFSLTMEAPVPQPLCAFALGFAAAAVPLPIAPCANLLLEPAALQTVLVGATGAGATFVLPLAIPNVAGLAGLTVRAQTLHHVGAPGAFESSPGLAFTVR